MVDDDVVVSMLLAMGLDDVEVLEASRVGEGMAIAQREAPDAAVVDRTLPDGDGLALVRRLRVHRATSDLPIVVLTAGHREESRSEVMRAGADDYLAKPVAADDVEALVRQLCAMSPSDLRARRERRARALPLRASTEADST